jgi:hypothetical protein
MRPASEVGSNGIGDAMSTVQSTLLAVDLNHQGTYVNWGVVHISVANLVVTLVMILLFVAALLLPFPGTKRRR